MGSAPQSIKALRGFYKDKLALPDFEELKAELTGTSDRAMVITLAAFLDDALEFAIGHRKLRKMGEDEWKAAFRFDGPLGSFSNRIELAYLLDVIDEKIKEQLTCIREMRNACAHSRLPISFENSPLSIVALRILRPVGFMDAPSNDNARIRSAFLGEGLLLYGILVSGREQALKNLSEAFIKEYGAEPPPLPDKPTPQSTEPDHR